MIRADESNMSGSSTSSSRMGSSRGSGRQTTSVCAFWLGHRAFALDTSILGGVVSVDEVTPVPGAAQAILGLFNLRGTPVALIDLASVVEEPAKLLADGNKTALILRPGANILAGLLIDRMELVVRLDHGHFTLGDPSEDSPIVQGFFEVESRGGMILTVLDADVLLQQLEKMKYR